MATRMILTAMTENKKREVSFRKNYKKRAYIMKYQSLGIIIINYIIIRCFIVASDVVERMKSRRSAKSSGTEEAMDTSDDRTPVSLSSER